MLKFGSTAAYSIDVVNSNSYAANRVVGGPLFAEVAPDGGILQQLTLDDTTNVKAPLMLHLFREQPTVIADGAVFSFVRMDRKIRLASFEILADDYIDVGSGAARDFRQMGLSFPRSLWMYIVTRDPASYPTTEALILNMVVIRD